MAAEKIIASLFDDFLRKDKPVQQTHKEKTTLINLRVPEKIRNEFQIYCLKKTQRTGVKTDMSKEILAFIFDCLEHADEN